MSDTIIKVENVSKQYRLGELGTGTLTNDLNRWWARIRGKEDPLSKVGDVNDRTRKGESNYVWALRDINFEVKRGEVLGIVGRNGAGKSTLLKILSKVTLPTTGEIKIGGRIASLLEVGTGFHPDLTGRENVFLNGAILGMTKAEIKGKFDEIVDFAGVERYIDTPVKRYSSGMHVRLAFAVAAHLEPEILIVDEVLAVGDAEFQKKCLGKMDEVSNRDGRTILFVSHNMNAVKNLCPRAVYLRNGMVELISDTGHVVDHYLNSVKQNTEKGVRRIDNKGEHGKLTISEIKGFNSKNEASDIFLCGEEIRLTIVFDNPGNLTRVKGRVDIGVNSYFDTKIAWLSTSMEDDYLDIGDNEITFVIRRFPLVPGSYTLNIYCEIEHDVAERLENIYSFEILESDFYPNGRNIPRGQGYLCLDYKVN